MIATIGADTNNPKADRYGHINGGLTNGIRILTRKSDGSINWLTGNEGSVYIKTNGDWGKYCYDVKVTGFAGGALDYILVRWSFDKAGGPIVLHAGDSIEVELNDDLTSNVPEHFFHIQGLKGPLTKRFQSQMGNNSW